MKMRIEGLTDAQCKILDRMWEAETVEELFDFFSILTEAEYQMALTLHEMLMHEIGEEETKNVTLAKEMLENIGVKV